MTKAAGGLVDVADLGTDTGWQPITLEAGLTNVASYALSYRVLNGVTYLRGRVDTGSLVSGNIALNTANPLPTGSRPGVPIWDLGPISNGAGDTAYARVWVTSGGVINGNIVGTTLDEIWVFGSYPADA